MKDDRVFLNHILDAIKAIESYTSGVSDAEFLANPMMQDAVVRQLEIVGEASRNLSDEIRNSNPQVEWYQIIGMRNRLVHAYFQVDKEVVWEIVKYDLPSLKQNIVDMLKQ